MAVGAANALDFLHRIARSRQIRKVAAFCDDATQTAAALLEPAPGIGDLRCHRRQPEHAMAARYGRNCLGRMSALIAPSSCSDPVATQSATD